MPSSVHLSHDSLGRLVQASRLSGAWWEEILGVRSLDERFSSPEPIQLSENALCSLAEALELDPQNIVLQKVDYRALEARQDGQVNALPEIYSAAASSRVRTSSHLFDAVERRLGWKARSTLVRRLQVSESFLRESDLSVNINFVRDVCDAIEGLGVQDTDFYRLGVHSLFRNYHSPLGEEFRKTTSTRQLHEKCFNELIQKYYDRNFIYRLVRLDDEGCIVEAQCDPDVTDALQDRHLGSAAVCAAKAGGFASLPGYIGRAFSEVKERCCVHRGDDRCRFEIRFSAEEATPGWARKIG